MNSVEFDFQYRKFQEFAGETPFDIEGDFSDFDRVFYQRDNKNGRNSLLLFSVKRQEFLSLDLEDKRLSRLKLETEKEYQQVEAYDKKLFCVNRESLIMDVFFLAKRQQFYHKRSIRFTNKELRLREEFCLIVWKHHEAGVLYRCLLGPLEDGRYMNFDLPERYFDYKAETEQIVSRVVFVSLALEDETSNPREVVCALDEGKKSVICFDRETQNFFEYNGFSGDDSKPLRVLYGNEDLGGNDAIFLEVIFKKRMSHKKLRRMYFYYPYDYFTQKEKNQLQASARKSGQKTELAAFVRNRYREVLLCMEGSDLLKMSLLEEMPLANLDCVWKINVVDGNDTCVPVDIAVNEDTGEIYCLCEQGIRIRKNSGRKSGIYRENINVKKMGFFNTESHT